MLSLHNKICDFYLLLMASIFTIYGVWTILFGLVGEVRVFCK